MREILFKAKRIDNGEWVEGTYLCRENWKWVECKKATHFILVQDEYGFTWRKIDVETLCQFTGLTDKNGKRIWENDICNRKEKYPEIVKYHKGDFILDYSYALGKETGYNYCNLGFYVCERKVVEVIGNVFDNPELLEGSNT